MLKVIKREIFVEMVESGHLFSVPFGFEGRYFVSKNGEIYSDRGDQVIQLNPTQDTKGVWSIALGTESGFKYHDMADIVLSASSGTKPSGMKAIFRNGDTDNYTLENLKWVTEAEYKVLIVKCKSTSIVKKEEAAKECINVEIPSAPYVKKYKMDEAHFDMLVGALEPIYKEIKNIRLEQLNPNTPLLLFNSHENSAVTVRDGQRIQEFFSCLKVIEEESKDNEKTI